MAKLTAEELKGLGILGALAVLGMGWWADALIEGRVKHQTDQAHHLQLDQLPPHLQEWYDLQKRQKQEMAQVDEAHSTLTRVDRTAGGLAVVKDALEDYRYAVDHAVELARDVKKPDEGTTEITDGAEGSGFAP